MKSYQILECKNLQAISNELYDFILSKKQTERADLKFWNFLTKQDLYELTKTCSHTMTWFNDLELKIREASFTIYNDKIQTTPHVDAPPVIAKINIPVVNTKDTYNVWFDENKLEIDRVECVQPIVLRSDILHTVEIGSNAVFPRIQMSFCFYKEPIGYLE